MDSLFLRHYSGVLIPLTYIYGLGVFERLLSFGHTSIIGIGFIIFSLLLYLHNVNNDNINDKKFLQWGIILLLLSYILINSYIWISLLLVLLTLCMLIFGLIKDINMVNSRITLIGIILLLTGLCLIIKERNTYPVYRWGLIFSIVGLNIILFQTINIY